jgi:hypothetical protein
MERASATSSKTGISLASAISLIFSATRSCPLAITTGAAVSSRT